METTLLFMDDNVSLVESVTRYLGEIRPQWRFLLAHSLAEARRVYNLWVPDAAVLDVSLPDGNGLDLLSELKHRRPALPVIMISGDDPYVLRQAVSDRGGYSLLEKPFSVPALVKNIESAISASRSQSPISRPTPGIMTPRQNPHALVRCPECRQLALYAPDFERAIFFGNNG